MDLPAHKKRRHIEGAFIGNKACEVCLRKYAAVTTDYGVFICNPCRREGKRAECMDCVAVRRLYKWKDIYIDPAKRPYCPECNERGRRDEPK